MHVFWREQPWSFFVYIVAIDDMFSQSENSIVLFFPIDGLIGGFLVS
jgi:hypothetical protein